VGWGRPTTQTIEYSSTSPRIRKTPEGDGTVITASANAYNFSGLGKSLFFNQALFNRERKEGISHADILEAEPVRETISRALATSSPALFSKYISHTKPKADDHPWMKWITVSVHSPVDLDVYNNEGKHMGLVPVPGTDLVMMENTIGGEIDVIGDEKYFTIPADDTYTIKLTGTGIGSFTYQVQKFVGSGMTEVSNVVYAGLPVTPLLVASTTISSSVLTAPLNLDVDGNGTTDITTSPSPTSNPLIHLDSMETIIRSFGLTQKTEKDLLKKIEKVRKNVEKNKDKSRDKIQKVLAKAIDKHWDRKHITYEDKNLLISIFDPLLSSLESLD